MIELDLDRALASTEQAHAGAQTAVASLTYQGLPLFADPEQQAQLMERALAPLQQAVERCATLAEQAEAEAKKLDTVANADIWVGMSTADLQRAVSLRPLIAKFISDATGVELAQRLAWVAAHGAHVEKTLYFDLASQRRDVIGQTLSALNQLVDPKQAEAAEKAAAQAAALRQKAANVRFQSAQLLSELDGSQAAALKARRAEYAGYF